MKFHLNECTNGETRLLTYGEDKRGYATAVKSVNPTTEQILEACNKLLDESTKTPLLQA